MSRNTLTAFADAVLQQILDAGSAILEDNLVVSLPAYLLERAMPGILAQLRILARHIVTQHSGWYQMPYLMLISLLGFLIQVTINEGQSV